MTDPSDSLPDGARQAPSEPVSPPTSSARETAPHPRPVAPAGPPSPPASETAPHPRPPVPPGPPPAPMQVAGNVGGDVAAGDIRKTQTAGRDIVGRDLVTETNTTNVGFSAAAVQRLLVTVGALICATAACFFAFGAVTVGVVVVALDRPGASTNVAAAEQFANKLADLQHLPPGQTFRLTFTEEEISSYFNLFAARQLPGDIRDGKVRLLDSGQLVLGGRWGSLGGLPFAATFAWQATPGAPLRLTGAWAKVVPIDHSPLGWLALPITVLKPAENSLNGLFGKVQFTTVIPSADGPAWTVMGVGQ